MAWPAAPGRLADRLTLEAGEDRAAISAVITELVEANRKALEKAALFVLQSLVGRHAASLT